MAAGRYFLAIWRSLLLQAAAPWADGLLQGVREGACRKTKRCGQLLPGAISKEVMPELVLTGAAGRIEARYSPRKEETAPIALILHPHPKAGGHMDNPVAGQLFHLFMKRGFSVMRFNFRGVGRRQGEFDAGS